MSEIPSPSSPTPSNPPTARAAAMNEESATQTTTRSSPSAPGSSSSRRSSSGGVPSSAISSHYKFSTAGSFCNCAKFGDLRILLCRCGENPESQFRWVYSQSRKTSSVVLEENGREIKFHTTFSSGTAACMGDTLLTAGKHYYWELRMITPVYGTDVMIGVATERANIDSHINSFSSLLGKDTESWGYSYHGNIRHNGKVKKYYNGRIWGQGAILGVHLDMWRGTLEFYVNRKPLGVAFSGIPLTGVYPIVSSTAAKSGMRLICAQSHESSLAFDCIRALMKNIPPEQSGGGGLFNRISMPPGLKVFVENNFWFLVQSRVKPLASNDKDDEKASLSSSSKKKDKKENSKRGTLTLSLQSKNKRIKSDLK